MISISSFFLLTWLIRGAAIGKTGKSNGLTYILRLLIEVNPSISFKMHFITLCLACLKFMVDPLSNFAMGTRAYSKVPIIRTGTYASSAEYSYVLPNWPYVRYV